MTKKKQLVKMTKGAMGVILSNWNQLHETINDYSEDELKQLLKHEATNRRRSQIISRLHSRYCKLRNQRERTEYLSKAIS